MLHAPLEQFQILSLVSFSIFSLDFSFTNFLLINLLALLSYVSFIYFNSSHKNYLQETSFYLAPNAWQKSIESVSELTTQLISDIISTDNEKYFPFISVLFNFILFSNLIGLIPYSFTATSHLIVTFTLSFSVFIGINIITFQKYKMKTFSLFLPANTTFFLALLLVPIEFISYIAKPISLGVRLFINLMAGHSLLKVIIGFSWSMLLLENFTSIGLILPMIILVILFGLELGVALIQTYVFIILTCIYIQDGS
jgi:F-type H+-transporting ATPase subunit a|uniref:ATP synthase F0 subunit 6 n=1 Tax=Gomphonema parvulum TaxID=97227 RepID=UPI0022084FEB|nr:ATP synthase F0 subunit 6 [Gomphonema parvulum]UXX44722.1 ATP synthase F0 subunit 6 [Gomphonema parvulum]